jgi:hypothetical protein
VVRADYGARGLASVRSVLDHGKGVLRNHLPDPANHADRTVTSGDLGDDPLFCKERAPHIGEARSSKEGDYPALDISL